MNTRISDLDLISKKFDSDSYQLIEKIGEGGFASVYRAVLLKTGQEVAIKFLNINADFDAEKKQRYIDRFERETLLVSKLQHPNIVRLLDKGRSNDHLLYAVFEYVQGQTLKQVIAQSGALKPVMAAEIMTQVLDALAHAHQLGVIHRDIKPANIMLTQTGAKTHVKVLDFGIGTLINDAQHSDYKSITLTQETLGTPSYSAPEQLRGEPPTVKTDIYVWALVFIECLTAKPAMAGSSIASIFHKQLSQNNVPLSAALMGHPIAAILRRALQKKSHERTVTAQELFAEVSQLNFANLVGDLSGQEPSKQAFNETTLSDNTMISAHAINHTGQTERKQITALAVTITLRRTNNEHFDSEVIEAIHHDLKNQCIDIAIRYGAYHVGSLGHQLLFYFGYPTVSDNDSRLSARTALEISSVLQKRSSLLRVSQGIEAKAKIGMNTGVVTCFADTSPEGETANIALELSAMAEPEQILCSQSSQNILNCYLEFQPKQRSLTGMNNVLQLTYLLTAERQAEAFGFLRGHRRNHAFFGRERQLQGLIDCFQDDAPANKLVHIHGEAGIGKSRLVFELRDKAVGHPQLVAQCLPEQQNNALFPILNLVQYKYSLSTMSDDAAARYLYQQAKDLAGDIKFFSEGVATLLAWLNLPLPEPLSPPGLDIEQQKMAMFAVIAQLLLSNNHSNLKQVIIVEDVHWIDPTSRDFLLCLIKSASAQQNLLMTTSRHELDALFTSIPHDVIGLKHLSPQTTSLFIKSLFDNEIVAQNVTDLLVNRTDGIPLFIEELVDMLKKNNLVHKLNGIIDFVSPDKLDEVPSTLRDSLQQKLDSLVYAKETVQLAATIGREFDYQLLASVSTQTEAQIQTDLNELLAADLIIQHRRVEGDSYIFKHALVRDAAYEGIHHSHRVSKHLSVAKALALQSNEASQQNPWLIASHFAMAKDYLNMSDWAQIHFLRLAKLSLNQEVITDSECVRKWLNSAPDDWSEKNELLVVLNHSVIPAYTKKMGWGHQRLQELAQFNIDFTQHNHAAELTRVTHLNEVAYKAKWTLFAFNHYQGNRAEARRLGEAIYKSELVKTNRINRLMLITMLGQAYFFDGDFDLAKEMLEEVIQNYDKTLDLELNVEFGFDPYLMALGNLMSIEAMAGRLEQAIFYRSQCLEHALATNNKATILTGYTWGTCYFFLINDQEGMATWCKDARLNSPDVFESEWIQRYFNMNEDWSFHRVEHGLKVVAEDIESGQTGILGWYEPPLANSLMQIKQYQQAHTLMSESYQRAKASGDSCITAITLRELACAEFYCHQHMTETAKKYFDLSIEFAQKTQSPFIELITLYQYISCYKQQKSGISHDLTGLFNRLAELLPTFEISEENIWIKSCLTLMEKRNERD